MHALYSTTKALLWVGLIISLTFTATLILIKPAHARHFIDSPSRLAVPSLNNLLTPKKDYYSAVKAQQEDSGEPPEDFDDCDPRSSRQQKRDVLRDIKNIKRDIKRALKTAQKLKVDAVIAELQALSQELAGVEANIQNPPADMTVCDAAQDFWNGNYWDTMNELRRKVELPREMAQIGKEFKRLNKALVSPSTLKALAALGVNIDSLKKNVADIQALYDEAQSAYTSGDYEGAELALQDMYDGSHPGEAQGVIFQLRDIYQRTRFIKDEELMAELRSLWEGAVTILNEEGDFRATRESLDQIMQVFWQLLPQLEQLRFSKKSRKALFGKFDKLEQIIGRKLGGESVNIFEQFGEIFGPDFNGGHMPGEEGEEGEEVPRAPEPIPSEFLQPF